MRKNLILALFVVLLVLAVLSFSACGKEETSDDEQILTIDISASDVFCIKLYWNYQEYSIDRDSDPQSVEEVVGLVNGEYAAFNRWFNTATGSGDRIDFYDGDGNLIEGHILFPGDQHSISSFTAESDNLIMYTNEFTHENILRISELFTKDAGALNERRLTLDDVRRLSQKGDALSWGDFNAYEGADIGSGMYVMQYIIDDLFDVLVGGGDKESAPEYVWLRNRDINAWVDIRTQEIEEFIKVYSSAAVSADALHP